MKTERRVKLGKVLIFVVVFVAFLCIGCASAATYTVCPSGCDYASIQAAIGAADPGDIIEVHSGTYYENVLVNKQLILKGVGTGSGKPVVDSGGNDSVITLSANGITFEGFTVTNSGNLYGGVGIKVTSNNNTIIGNTASNNGYSICLNDSCNNTISGNNASNNDYGIYLNDSCNNTISGNTVSNNVGGIYLNDSCNNNTISGNIVSNNGYGIYLRYSCNNSITGNNANNNNEDGIGLSSSCNNTITGNNASNNNDGICLRDSSNNIISNNTFVNDGFFVERSYQNTVEDNIVNGKPLVYLEEASGIGVTDAGQVILVNCTNITVENLDLSATSVCVELWETEGSIISNNTVSNSIHGIYLSSSSNNTITGNNASNNNGDGIYLSSSSNNTITENNAGNNGDGIYLSSSSNNNRIIGNNVSGSNHGAGIRFRRSNNNTLIGNTASNNWDGIYISSSSNNTITGNSVSNNFDGINFQDSSNNTITGNNVSNNALGIVLSYSSNNNTITGNVFVNDGLFGGYQNMVKDNTVNGKPLVYLEDASDYTVEDAGQVILVNCTNITVENLDLSHTSMGIILLNTKDSEILNNTASNSYCGCGIYLPSSCNNTLKRNNISSNLVGICLSSSCNNTITGNNASNNNGGGISLSSSCNNTITENNAGNNGDGICISSSSNNNIVTDNNVSNNEDGIYLSSSSNNNIVTGNNVSNNEDGIYLSSSSNSTITGNNVCSNNGDGISLVSSSNNTITGNNVSNNFDEGISIKSSSNNNTITGNNVNSNNGDGIYLYYSPSNNKIYLNNFINNTDNVYSEGSSNIWNATEKITYTYSGNTYTNYLGNYWCNYIGNDTNNDGIGDISYNIDSDKDNYPLMQTWENYFATVSTFDTGPGTYPSIMGTHTGTIIPSSNHTVSKLYTYPCTGTGGHTESIKLYENGILIANGTWTGYHEDWHNITLYNVTDGASYVTLLQDHEYNYTIRTGSYPQILHATSKEVTGGTITCSSFVDANGNIYTDWIPAIRLEE